MNALDDALLEVATETSPLLKQDDKQQDPSENEGNTATRTTPKETTVTMTTTTTTTTTTGTVHVLVELIGARRLPITSNMDTYCVVQYGTKTIHKTEPFAANLSKVTRVSRALWRLGSKRAQRSYQKALQNPIWTVHEHAVLAVPISRRDLANSKALIVTLWARPQPATTTRTTTITTTTARQSTRAQVQFVGKCRIKSPQILQHVNEQRLEIPLESELGQAITEGSSSSSSSSSSATGGEASTLAIRFRMASAADIAFCQHWNKTANEDDSNSIIQPTQLLMEGDILQDPDYIRGALVTERDVKDIKGSTMLTAAVASSLSPRSRGLIRVKPYPHPHQPDTEYLTKPEFKVMTRLPSQKWLQAGSQGSSLGRLYVEILSAHDLPNVDFGSTVGNETDAFCTVVYGDAMVQTDVIDDELNPHWLPWTQRAFLFTMQHPTQVLYLGVFGFKRNALLNHKPIGRVEINPNNLQNNTTYNLEYNLMGASHATERLARGRIKIRLRLEVQDERQALFAALKPPPAIYVNVTQKKSLQVARYTCCGEYNNEEKFSVQVLQGYIAEILDGYLKTILDSIKEGGTSLIFWRSQVHFCKIGFPLYSLLAFVIGIAVVENPEYLPASIFFGLAALFLVQMQQRLNYPSPWQRCLSFGHYLRILVMGKSLPTYTTIEANAGEGEIQARQADLERRMEEEKRFEEKRELIEKELEELEGQGNVQTKSTGIPLELLVVLGKIQSIVGGICRLLRAIEVVITWEESSLAFLITFCLLVGGFVSLFLPWAFLLKLSGRVLVVVLLGPQNKLIDKFWNCRQEENDDQKIRKLFRERFQEARYKQEEARKLKAFRQLLFGKYSTFVPSIMWTPHQDFPLPSSTAHVEKKSEDTESDQSTTFPYVVGQQLWGNMIPRPEQAWMRNEQESKILKAEVERLLSEAESLRESNTETTTREPSMMLEEGFEVVDMFDEEAGFVRNASKPEPPEESLRELGIEIQENDQSMRFTPAWKSTEELPLDDQSSHRSDDSFARVQAETHDRQSPIHDPCVTKSMEHTATESSDEIMEPATDEGTEELPGDGLLTETNSDGSFTHVNTATTNQTKVGISVANERQQSTIELGVEIMEQFSAEAEFAQKSWPETSTTTSPEGSFVLQFSPVVIEDHDGGIEVKASSDSNESSGNLGETRVLPERNEMWEDLGSDSLV